MKAGVCQSPVTMRVTKRYYWSGKGYATKQQAYKAKAKRILLEMVLGPAEEVYYGDENNEGSRVSLVWADANLNGLDKAQKTEKIAARFAEFFPHDWHEGCVQGGCVHVSKDLPSWQQFACNQEGYDAYGDPRGEFLWPSCKWSQDAWIAAKVKELMDADK